MIAHRRYPFRFQAAEQTLHGGIVGSLLLGGSKVNPLKFTDFLNKNSSEGWRVQTMEKDIRRMLLFWKREAYVVILGRNT
ncbi:protein of unknown function [Halopseudomonas litoralis]|uniref:DUF4177 domain-containing protein n=1 Tax=Halopseudomonas litoralis TaxID=797277 RepID=A0A1H1LP36_9GAMM|nr:protein of unknown function [Halopseudomonas litoralis]